MKTQSYKKGWALVLTLAMVFTTLFGGFGFLGINGMVGEVYAVAPGSTSTSQTWDTNGTVSAITIDGAATVITINPGVTVTVNGTITIDGNVTITGGGILLRGSGVTGNMILVNSDKTLTINGVTIDGDNIDSGYDSPLIANDGGTLNINDGAVIENNKSRGIWNGGATAILNMTGGIIQNCSMTTVSTAGGGGVANVWGATFNMTGGLIKNCSTNWHGGGVYNSDSSIFNMSDGIIEYCSVTNASTYAQGGGVDNANNSNFTMSGGTIQNCSAIANSGSAYGGGVSNYSSTFTMSGGTIKDCNATGIDSAVTYGGGIFQIGNLYISGNPVIQNNTKMGSTPNNIDLHSNTRVVTVNNAMTNATKIGVYAHNPSDSLTVLTGTAIDADSLNHFSSENSGYILSYSTPGSIQMIVPPTISVNDSSVTEGNSGVANLVFTVSLSATSVQTVTVDYATADGTATAGSDYSSTSGALSFAPGETSKTVDVVISGDTTVESNETIFLNLSSPTKATISDAQGIGTITNDDAADTTPPAAPVIVTPANGSITNDNTPTCSGTAEVGSTITVRVDGTTVGTTTANGSGNWIYTSAALAEGSHTVQSTATDGAGNTSANSSSNSFTVDTTQPTLSGATASAITKNSATLNFTSNEAGTYYYLIYASATGAPDEATIKAQGASIAKGTAAAIAAANTANVSGLAALTTYKAYVIVDDACANTSAVSTITFTTRADYPTALVNNSFEIPTLGATHATNWWTDYTPTTPEAKAAFGWKTTATGTDEKFEVGGDWNTTGWGIGFIPDGRQFIELNANTQAAAYQDLNTTPGSVIYWSLYQGGVWYSSSPNINNTMAVRIGSPEQLSTSAIMIQTTDTGYDQRWTTRTIYNNATMTAINTTPTTYGAMELTKKILYTEPKRWTKYEGTYEVPAGQTETRFAFASLSAEPTQGNLLDGVVFRIANTTKAITAFNFNGLTPNVTGTINANTIALTVPYGTDVTALVPTITHTGASVSPSAVVAQNFTGPVTYTVTPETGAAQEYVVTVTVAMPTKAITAFNFNGLTPNVTGTVNETAKTIALTVPYGTDVTALVPTITYSGVSITSNSGIAQNFTSPVTYTVTAADSTTQAYIVTVTVASNGGGGGGHSSTPTAPANATVTVNGQSQDAGITTTSKVGDKTVTTVTIDDKKIQEKIKEEGKQSTVSIPIGGNSDIGEGVLNGQTIKDMENKESVLEIKTNSTTYTLPASEINIDSVSSHFGQTVDLKDIKISVRIAEPSADTTKIVQDTANKNNYQVVVKPVDFEITCTSGSKTVTVSKFNGYVERMVAIPDGIDPSKVTTGIVLNNDGTFSHVPTTIVKIDGKYYAKINSLTNSTYSVIYNPIEFADVAKHWAKDSINEMGSRLVISGVGGNNYEPNRDITRAEFAAIMVRALGLVPDTAKNNFNDVADSKWYSGYVGTAASYGIISGYDTDTFAPNDKITREQAMTMVARAMAITDLEATTADLNTGTPLTGYSDTNKISGYAKASIITCLNTGVVTGKTAETIAPKANITRAEVAVIIERLLKKSELI